MPRKVIICADGTWNTENQADHGTPNPTNVVKIARALLPQDQKGSSQIIYYHSGVGTTAGQRFGGGAFGEGLFANVQDCYRFLVHNYAPGDLLYFFGFSRGAYTVRSLAGLIRNCGILRQGHEDEEGVAFRKYRDYGEKNVPDSPEMEQFRRDHSYTTDGDTNQPIEMIGVWDTVGALGIPGKNLFFRLPDGLDWQFHDVKLSSYVKNAFHALAIHEHRKEFLPTLWEQSESGRTRGQRLEQVWFTGAHSDVGGGYAQAGLSDLPLLWMIQRAEKCGLEFAAEAVKRIKGDALADAHDSFSTLYKIIDAVGLHPEGIWRKIGKLGPEPGYESIWPGFEGIHESVVKRYHQEPKIAPRFWPDSFENIIQKMPIVPIQASSPTKNAPQPSASVQAKTGSSSR